MKLPLKIVGPVGLAIAIALVIGGMLLWQIRSTISIIERSFGRSDAPGSILSLLKSRHQDNSIAFGTPEALVELRRGELLEIAGEWRRAEEQYRKSVDA
jgi:hypothetical protein